MLWGGGGARGAYLAHGLMYLIRQEGITPNTFGTGGLWPKKDMTRF